VHTLQCAAVCCSVVQRVAIVKDPAIGPSVCAYATVCCIVLAAVCCSVLHCVLVCCSVVQCVALVKDPAIGLSAYAITMDGAYL